MSKARRIGLALSAALVVGALGYLALGNFSENLVYFFTPSEVIAMSPDDYGRKVRVGGMVVKQSLKVIPESRQMTFELTDGAATIPVSFTGVPPDLFKEGQGAVVEGYWDNSRQFHSDMIMAKHSEDYMPVELKRAGVEMPKKDFLRTLNQP